MIGELLTIGDVTGRVIRMADPETVVLFDGKKNHEVKIPKMKKCLNCEIEKLESQFDGKYCNRCMEKAKEKQSIGIKACSKCKVEKPINEFRQFKSDRISKMCDDCRDKNAKAGTINMNKETQSDPVNHPSHYQGLKGLEVREVMENFVPKYDQYGGLVSCDIKDAIKYILRAPDKNGLEDLKKAQRMISYVIDSVEGTE